MREGLKGGKGRSRPRYSNNNNNINTNTKKKDDKGGRDPQLGRWHLSIYQSFCLSIIYLYIHISIYLQRYLSLTWLVSFFLSN